MLTVILIVIGLLVALIGLAGCILPVIPGPVVSYLSLLVLSLARGWEPFSLTFLLIMAGAAALMTVLDYFVAAAGAKKYGASSAGVWGSVIGMILGIFLIPPWGILLGAIAGAVIGELAVGKKTGQAIRAGWGVIIGNVVATALKLGYCFVVLFFYLKEMI